MALQISSEDTQVLLKDKNVLVDQNLDKYRTAGQITQTALKYLVGLINDSYHLKKTERRWKISELCALTDSFMEQCLKDVFANKVNEKGIAHPTTIDIDEIAQGWAPELLDEEALPGMNQNEERSRSVILGEFQEGDILKITVGCHVDGYTAHLSHTLVVYPTVEDPVTQQLVAAGPLLGSKADAIAAAHIVIESVSNLLACALAPEKLPAVFSERQVTGSAIRTVVDTIAKAYSCAVVPGSRVRRVRRFLAGQNEGIVAERDVKGVHWTESHQEAQLLAASVESTELLHKPAASKHINESAIATDDFVVLPGEVFLIDIRMAPLSDLPRGLVTLQDVDQFSGKSHRKNDLVARPAIVCRDFAKQHTLKLKSSRQLLHKLESRGVYPTKLSHVASTFPLDVNAPDFEALRRELKTLRFSLAEISNNYLATEKPVQICKLVPWKAILNTANPTGAHGVDAVNPALPGYEVPLPQLGISSLKLKSLLKEGIEVPVAREAITVTLCSADVCASGKPELLKLNGGSTAKPSWVQSKFELDSSSAMVQAIFQLAELAKDKRFGLAIRETQPWKTKTDTDVAME
ncbi:HGL149Cp [Eremothecium sinecaudum]|uniref:Probable metalloprotease ARX1 n=1 Tax=Eremothecium sinecaudum TaxID=45286 RepID=A0A0X8HVB9_9SACH|nr:HGL149Cp [Eremothecium sinecaudum]AMD22191.1 HGL149Cp [Eremothecium sinecaudum]